MSEQVFRSGKFFLASGGDLGDSLSAPHARPQRHRAPRRHHRPALEHCIPEPPPMRFNLWRKWLNRAFGLTRTAPIRRNYRPRLEALEDRWVPAIAATGQATSFIEGVANPVVVATFTDTSPSPATDYTATIAWGDTTSSTGAVSLSGTTYTVTGTHTYPDETPAGSPHTVTVTITETVGDMDTATATGSASVAEGDTLS